MPHKKFHIKNESEVNKRVDLYLRERINELSRSQVQNLIQQQKVWLNSEPVQKSGHILKYGDQVEIKYQIPGPVKIIPEDIPLDIVYHDKYLAVINKASGMVVHPGINVHSHTLVNALVHHFPEIINVGPETRPGIVHRLDKETSGLLVIAKNLKAYKSLKTQFKKRQVQKKYTALVWGRYSREQGVLSWPIGRHVKNGARMSTKTDKPKRAETHFEVQKVFEEHSLLDVKPITGRTHQIRVHLAASGHPVVGDPLYGKRKKSNRLESRLFLHAYYLSFIHPKTRMRREYTIPIPDDLQNTLDELELR